MSEELKTCPFCGLKAVMLKCSSDGSAMTKDHNLSVIRGKPLDHYCVRCSGCRNRTDTYLTKRGAFNAWNRRLDVEPVRYAHWIADDFQNYAGCTYEYYRCSACKREVRKLANNGFTARDHFPYCHCGAKMIERAEYETN